MPSLVSRLYRRVRFGAPIVVVSGLPRSGTSMMMGMLAAGGMQVVADETRAADESNPLGYFEDPRVERLNTDPDRRWLVAARGRAIKIISFLLPYLPGDNNYRIIFMHRDLDEVIASQNAMLRRRGQEVDPGRDLEARQSWEAHVRKIRAFISRQPCFELLDVDYNATMVDCAAEAARVNRFLGGGLDVHRMVASVEPKLYRNRRAGSQSA